MTNNLYLKYRPKTWDEIVGQEEVVKSLRKYAIAGKAPSMLFSGGHGTGKTTSAFILAKALNCEDLQEGGNPCNKCGSCRAIDEGRQIGFRYEAMSNNGSADDVRKLMKDASLKQPIKQKVYILDEVHNLSNAAFDSLLIPLEDKNNDTLFILCSTEPEKIRSAVLSRLQNRTFAPVSNLKIAELLMRIKNEEGIDNVSKEDIINAATYAKGSVRDAVQNLESLANGISLESKVSTELAASLIRKDIPKMFVTITDAVTSGKNLSKVAQDLYKNLTDALLVASGVKISDPVALGIAKHIDKVELLPLLDILGEGITKMTSKNVDSSVLLQVYLTRMILYRNKKGVS